jgi:hypothetical protein
MQYFLNFFKHYWVNTIHKFWVAYYLLKIALPLIGRAFTHDISKYGIAESKGFVKVIHLLGTSKYGSDEYRRTLRTIKPSLKHHYQSNPHHPEYHENDIKKMSLIDYIEMICDWKASTKRHKTGNLDKSIEINMDRFNLNQYDIHLISRIRNVIENDENCQKK